MESTGFRELEGGRVVGGDSLFQRLREEVYAKAFGRFILHERDSCGLSQAKFADEINKAQASTQKPLVGKTISNVENAKSSPPQRDTLSAIAAKLGCSDLRHLQEKFEESQFYLSIAPRVADVGASSALPGTPPDDDVARRIISKWDLLPASTRKGLILIDGGEAAYFEHFIRIISTGKSHRVLAYIQFGKEHNFLKFKMPGLYPALKKAVDEGRLVIEYILLLEKRKILEQKEVVEFITRYTTFAQRILLVFQDNPQLPPIANAHSIVLLTEVQIVFIHGRDADGKMIAPRQLMSLPQFEEHMANYRAISMSAEEYFVRPQTKSAR